MRVMRAAAGLTRLLSARSSTGAHIYDPKSVLRAISAAEFADAYLRGLHPKHEQFKRLRQALLAMNRGGGGGGSASRISAGPNFRPGDNDPQIAVIRKRLGAGLDGRRDTIYDTALLQAVNRYQKEHGLRVTGTIDQSCAPPSMDPRKARIEGRSRAIGIRFSG